MESMLINPLVVVRDLHLTATVVVAGIIFLDLYIAAPLWRRQSLLPHLLGIAGTGQASVALRKLVRSASVEVVLGLAIVCIVGLLGIMPPGE